MKVHWGDVWTVLPLWVWGFGRGRLDVLQHRIHQDWILLVAGLHENTHTQTHLKYRICHWLSQVYHWLKHTHRQVHNAIVSHLNVGVCVLHKTVNKWLDKDQTRFSSTHYCSYFFFFFGANRMLCKMRTQIKKSVMWTRLTIRSLENSLFVVIL